MPPACTSRAEAAATLSAQQPVIDQEQPGDRQHRKPARHRVYPTHTAPYSTVPAAGMRIAQFFAPAKVTMGTQYAIVLEARGDCSILPAIKGDYYADGHGYYDALPNPPGWVLLGISSPYDDLPFQTFVIPRD